MCAGVRVLCTPRQLVCVCGDAVCVCLLRYASRGTRSNVTATLRRRRCHRRRRFGRRHTGCLVHGLARRQRNNLMADINNNNDDDDNGARCHTSPLRVRVQLTASRVERRILVAARSACLLTLCAAYQPSTSCHWAAHCRGVVCVCVLVRVYICARVNSVRARRRTRRCWTVGAGTRAPSRGRPM